MICAAVKLTVRWALVAMTETLLLPACISARKYWRQSSTGVTSRSGATLSLAFKSHQLGRLSLTRRSAFCRQRV